MMSKIKKDEKGIILLIVIFQIFLLVNMITANSYMIHQTDSLTETKIIEEKRTLLGPKISYGLENGLTPEAVGRLMKKYRKTLDKINKYPKTMNFFREHIICSYPLYSVYLGNGLHYVRQSFPSIQVQSIFSCFLSK